MGESTDYDIRTLEGKVERIQMETAAQGARVQSLERESPQVWEAIDALRAAVVDLKVSVGSLASRLAVAFAIALFLGQIAATLIARRLVP